jgi:hypothetical protein
VNKVFAKTLAFLLLFSSLYSQETPWWEKDLPEGRVADYITEEDLEGCSEEELLYHPPWAIDEEECCEGSLDLPCLNASAWG